MLTFLNKTLDILSFIKKMNIAKDTMVMGMFIGLLGVLALETLNLLLGKKLYFSRIAATMLSNKFGSIKLENILLSFIMNFQPARHPQAPSSHKFINNSRTS